LDATRTSAEALGGELLAPGASGFLSFLNDALKSLRDSFADPMHPEQIERANLYADALARVPQLLNQSNQEMHGLQQQADSVRSSTEAQLKPLQDKLDALRRARAEHEALRSLSEAEAQLAQDQKDALDVSGPLGVSARRNLLADTQREAQARDAFNYFQQTQGITDRMNQIQAQGQQNLTPILDRITTLLENIYNLRQGKTPEVISAETGQGNGVLRRLSRVRRAPRPIRAGYSFPERLRSRLRRAWHRLRRCGLRHTGHRLRHTVGRLCRHVSGARQRRAG
jgi:vacuolar-type H+-ATPase subunit H